MWGSLLSGEIGKSSEWLPFSLLLLSRFTKVSPSGCFYSSDLWAFCLLEALVQKGQFRGLSWAELQNFLFSLPSWRLRNPNSKCTPLLPPRNTLNHPPQQFLNTKKKERNAVKTEAAFQSLTLLSALPPPVTKPWAPWRQADAPASTARWQAGPRLRHSPTEDVRWPACRLQASYLMYTKKETERNASASAQSFHDLLVHQRRERNDST